MDTTRVATGRVATGSPTPESPSSIHLRSRSLLLWFVLLLVASLLLPDKVWNTLLAGLGGLTLFAFFWARQLAAGLHISRRLRFGWVAVGDRLQEEFTLSNSASLPALWVEMIDESTVPGYQASVVRSAGSGDTVRWRQSAVCQRRGQYHLGPCSVRSGDPFGIFIVTSHYPARQEIIIHPPVYGRLPIPLPTGQSDGRAIRPQRAWRATINAAGVRDYHQDDPFRWIHWPTSAHRDDLYVRQFDRDTAGDIWLLLDCQAAVQLGEGTGSTEEQAVLLAASLATHALRQNRAVGLVTYGKQPQVVAPATGQGQQWRIMRALALTDAEGHIPLGRAMRDLGRSARRGAAAVIVTASGLAEWLPELLTLSRQGIEGHVVLLDRHSFGREDNTDGSVTLTSPAQALISAEGLRGAVIRLGYTCTIIRQGDLGHPLEEARHGFWEFKVTGLGKVITVRSPVEK